MGQFQFLFCSILFYSDGRSVNTDRSLSVRHWQTPILLTIDVIQNKQTKMAALPVFIESSALTIYASACSWPQQSEAESASLQMLYQSAWRSPDPVFPHLWGRPQYIWTSPAGAGSHSQPGVVPPPISELGLRNRGADSHPNHFTDGEPLERELKIAAWWSQQTHYLQKADT